MDLYENRSENSLKGDPLNDTTVNPPLFSLVNTFKEDTYFEIKYSIFELNIFVFFQRKSA